jgi:GAF domain-containing protein
MEQEFATRLLRCTNLQSVLDCVLDGGLQLTGATLGNVQLMDGESGFLTIAAQRGFNEEFLDFFQRVNADHVSACGRALSQQRAIVIKDVMSDEDFVPCLAIAERAGFRSVQSTPIVSSSGVVLGILSTHFPVPHQPNEGAMDALRSLASVAATAITRMRARLETIKQNSLGWQPVSSAPFDRDLELAVINYVGTHALVFPCRRVLGGWISAETKVRIDFHPTHWREWA